jgi:hypothetical protein
MQRELEGLSDAIDEIARIDEALAANFSQVAARLERQGLPLGAAPFHDMSRRHAQRASAARKRCAGFIDRYS